MSSNTTHSSKPSRANIPCRQYQTDSCKFSSEQCPYSHVRVPHTAMSPASSHQELISEHSSTRHDRHSRSASTPSRVRDIRSPSPGKMSSRYRTKPCVNFLSGNCSYGDKCSFAHVLPPLSPVVQSPAPWSPGYVSPVNANGWWDGSHADTRGRFVPELPPQPEMSDDESTYSSDVRGPPVSSPVMAVVHVPVYVPVPPTVPMFGGSGSGAPAPAPAPLTRDRSNSLGNTTSIHYKTRPCKFWNTDGHCPKGEKCTFIHETTQTRSHTPHSRQDKDPSSAHFSIPSPASSSTVSTPVGELLFPSVHTAPNSARPDLDDHGSWRVLGGGVKLGDYRTEHEEYQAENFGHRSAPRMYDTDSSTESEVASTENRQVRQLGQKMAKQLAINVPPPTMFVSKKWDEDEDEENWEDQQSPKARVMPRRESRFRSVPATPTKYTPVRAAFSHAET
ncbi:hypothetical protein SISSUDRAFT_1046322 [Sistotremastrum suecicum HHB10207 ss-3]|uniref:C3H1-type domain-containing protein n=1 Tax=Sistotremastrum suecicum HHB10207 ss-3 TaxID=1314776 RepID=A0A166DTC8_9AGAM|nr:hypothetical protein SISSUDRAFT_1046322 [Sistotremastrum suecicum HHB10207 ss-3]